MTAPDDAPLLSILIPTKNRYETLLPVVSEILAKISDPRLQIVICDNSSPRQDVVDTLVASDSRISYHYFSDEISIVDNTERGLDLCQGEYLCFIGDDDLVSPYIMRIVGWLKKIGGDCLIYPPARYWWSSVAFAKESQYLHPGAFWLPKARNGAVRQLDSAFELDRVLKRGGVAYLDLPRLYHGIASKRAVERVMKQFGRTVPGSSPDMALCVALALTNRNHYSIDYPVTVFGASRNSGGGWTAAKKHHGRIEDQKHLPRDILKNWNDNLPRIWTEQIIYPQTIHEVMSRIGRKPNLSYATTYASIAAYEPHVISALIPIASRYLSSNPGQIPKTFFQAALKVAGRIRVSINNRTGIAMPFDLYKFQTVADVMSFSKNIPLPEVVLEIL
ncbi:glycosyltransferase family 2 protein [Sphingomonas pseudosanguinis]|uniref:Glycosyltransferase involved in cell wall biosynthesis n=1 Tax=Sphingomonas pseudosanguinis TaxID=413712 RepID=A0A7W6AGG7_9SPHN|nr:glycosyltransferase [Sphingomonas pseudosanguinis]MBB3880136.1 glycosyltransferase involved in cell wall biosynthesis [Sphingomonas pseudosanguinis]MBN3538579.1 glycosyltransferase [Sphingomonas pseudosanguinis]